MNKVSLTQHDRIILGIDPGTNVLGYGLVAVAGKETQMLAMGVIDLRKVSDVYLKLGRIYERVMGVIDAFHPDELAIEAPFFGKNVQSMLKLGRAQGVAIAAAIAGQIPNTNLRLCRLNRLLWAMGQLLRSKWLALCSALSKSRMSVCYPT